jgi:hypothetical protein
MSLLHEWTIPNAACAIEFDRRDIKMNKLVAGTLEGTINVWDMRTKHPKKGYASLLEKVRCEQKKKNERRKKKSRSEKKKAGVVREG